MNFGPIQAIQRGGGEERETERDREREHPTAFGESNMSL